MGLLYAILNDNYINQNFCIVTAAGYHDDFLEHSMCDIMAGEMGYHYELWIQIVSIIDIDYYMLIICPKEWFKIH